MRICREVKNVVGWKITYMYDGFRIIAKGLRSLDRPVASWARWPPVSMNTRRQEMFDGTLSGFWTFAKEPMLDHLDAWDARDIDKACAIWNGGLCELHEYIADMGRLHIRYKTGPGCAD